VEREKKLAMVSLSTSPKSTAGRRAAFHAAPTHRSPPAPRTNQLRTTEFEQGRMNACADVVAAPSQVPKAARASSIF
jgi:hypothetical protein